ncbi:MAG TPA: LamG domain-containing protein [Bacteroidales bacterium]|nr:LamG domain-containing protein [Bacteroidales bacterium]
MKNIVFTGWLVLVSIITGIGFSSCEDDSDSNNNGKVDPGIIAASNLIAYFPFDKEPELNSAVEHSDNSITFVRKGGTATFANGKKGNAYQGNSTESFLEYNIAPGSALTGIDEFTLACWIKTPFTTSGAAKIFSINGGDSYLGNIALIQESRIIGDSVDLKLYLFDSNSPGWKNHEIRINKKQFVNDKWFHLAAIYRKSSSTMEFFANGKQVFSQVKYSGPITESGNQPLLEDIAPGSDMSKIYFGAWPQQIAGIAEGWMTYYKGLVDEFRIYSKALTLTEVEDLYKAEVSQSDN